MFFSASTLSRHTDMFSRVMVHQSRHLYSDPSSPSPLFSCRGSTVEDASINSDDRKVVGIGIRLVSDWACKMFKKSIPVQDFTELLNQRILCKLFSTWTVQLRGVQYSSVISIDSILNYYFRGSFDSIFEWHGSCLTAGCDCLVAFFLFFSRLRTRISTRNAIWHRTHIAI